MVFSSVPFLFYFLPLALGLTLVAPRRARNVVLLVASLVFYTFGSGSFVLVLLATSLVDFGLGLVIGRARREDRVRLLRAAVVASLVLDVGLLAWFKYANFVIDQLNVTRAAFGADALPWTEVLLPIGISFFTFQRMSYTLDVARGTCAPLRNPLDYLLYVTLFPQLIAGPIVRYHEIADQLRERDETWDDFGAGALRFIHGLAKKVLVADTVAVVADAAFSLPAAEMTTGAAWLGALAYTVQIYFDFSGYSDMAIGIGAMLGFRFPENFLRPYSALSITDFWRRWHVTLSHWFRDYLYIPLGGSRVGRLRTGRNLVLVFLLTGLWHGAAWTFVLWGAYHGALLVIERVTGQRAVDDDAGWKPVRRGVTFLLVVVGWVLFRADTVGQFGGMLGAMVAFDGAPLPASVATALQPKVALALVGGLAVALLPRGFVGGIELMRSPRRTVAAWRVATAALVFPYAGAVVASGSFSPFLYFRF